MKKMLLVIDAQYDFINGSLAVNGAEEKMTKLSEHIEKDNYDIIVFTADWHPNEHMSFVENGGQWPKHCVQYTHGAAIFQPLLEMTDKKNTFMRVLTKGDVPLKEEYSLMDNYFSSKEFLRLVGVNNIEQIDVCGIMSSYCVLETIKGLVENYNLNEKINVFLPYIAEIDKHEKLLDFCKNKNLHVISNL